MKTPKLALALDCLDDDLISATADDPVPAARRRNAHPWVRWAATAACLCAVLLGAFGAAALLTPDERGTPYDASLYEYEQEPDAPETSKAMPPPSRYGESTAEGCLGEVYTLEEAVVEADIVARVRVGSWLAENTEIISTYYEAEVLECFKGTIPETFVLKQDGSSECTAEEYPLFTDGNELLLFLNKASDDESDYAYDEYEGDSYCRESYWIIGAFTSVMYVLYDDAGNRYYADQMGTLSETITATPVSRTVSGEAHENAAELDPVIGSISFESVFPAADVEAQITELVGNG